MNYPEIRKKPNIIAMEAARKHNLGRKLTEEHKRKIGLSHIGKGHAVTQETRRKISISSKGKKKLPFSEQHKKNIGLGNLGRKRTEEHRKKMSEVRKGEKSYLWKGGITPINKVIRTSLEYKLWREAVFKRDNFTCIWCGQRGGNLNADHIKRFSDYPALRFAIDNGRTLCIPCHRKTDTWGRLAKIKTTR